MRNPFEAKRTANDVDGIGRTVAPIVACSNVLSPETRMAVPITNAPPPFLQRKSRTVTSPRKPDYPSFQTPNSSAPTAPPSPRTAEATAADTAVNNFRLMPPPSLPLASHTRDTRRWCCR